MTTPTDPDPRPAPAPDSETRWQFALEGAGDGVWDWDAQTNHVYFSHQWKAMLGYSDAEIGDTLAEWETRIHPDDKAQCFADLDRHFRGETPVYQNRHRVLCKDGRYKWILDRGKVMRWRADGQPARVVGTHTDLTDLMDSQQAEARARQAAAYARSLIEASLDPLVTISPAGVITDVNRATEEITGVARERLIGSDFSDYFTEPDQARRGYQQVFAQGSVMDYPLAIRHASGRIRAVLYNASVYRDEAGAVQGVFAAARDITERTLAEARVRQAAAYARSLIEASLDPLVTISPAGVITDVNRATEEITGVARERLIGSDFSDYFTEPDQARRGYQQVFAQGSVTDYPLAIRHTSGRIRAVLYNASVYRDEAGAVRGVFAAARDITERQRVEAELRALSDTLERRVHLRTADLTRVNAELARATRIKDEFLATISHELRTPLNGILGLAEALAEGVYGELTARQLETLNSLTEAGRRQLALVNDLLDLAALEAGQLALDPSPVEVEDVCQRSLRSMRAAAEAKNLRVSLALDDVPGLVWADDRRLRQMLDNLLSNAVKFTLAGGQIGLEVARQPDAPVVRFTVWDTGIGVPADKQALLFQLFSQVDSRLARQYEGTGLGLLLVRRLAELHGGSVGLEPAPSLGSRFFIDLPLAAAEPWPPAASAAEPAALPADAPLVLLAEHNPLHQRGLQTSLAAGGYRVSLAMNGEETLERAEEFPPAVIVLDLHLPLLTGWEVLEQLRARPKLAAVPVVAVTALSLPGDRERCLAAGASAYLTQPVSPARLLGAVRAGRST